MTKREKLKLLREWQETIENAGAVLAKLDEAIGRADGPLRDSVYRMEAVYTRAMSLLLNDEGNFLEWYALENDMGRKGLEAGLPGAMKPISSLSDLLEVMAA